MSERYRHTQVGPVTVIASIAGAAICVIAAVVTRSAGLLLAAAILLVLLSQFGRLTTVVQNDVFRCWFGSGLIRRTIPLSDIRQASVVRNRWFYGFGIRITPHGWLWNVSGLGAVELTLASGRRFRVGSDEPARLAAAIETSKRPEQPA